MINLKFTLAKLGFLQPLKPVESIIIIATWTGNLKEKNKERKLNYYNFCEQVSKV